MYPAKPAKKSASPNLVKNLKCFKPTSNKVSKAQAVNK